MYEDDWTEIESFKKKILSMRKDGVKFLSLKEAYSHIKKNYFRFNNYAVLTFDDGYATLLEILPWLEKENIPVVLFINGKYLDGKSYRENPSEKYLTYELLFQINSSSVEIGSHGWEHMDATKMTDQEFAMSIKKNVEILSQHPCYIPYHAYAWGRHSAISDKILDDMRIIPVMMDGMKNYDDKRVIHRELLGI